MTRATWRSACSPRGMNVMLPSPSNRPAAHAICSRVAMRPKARTERAFAQFAVSGLATKRHQISAGSRTWKRSDELGGAVGGLGAEHQREQRPAVLRVELDPAAHHLGQLARDRQPEPAARGPRAVEAVEALEDLLLGVARDLRPVVR